MITIRTCDSDNDIQILANTAKIIWNEYFIQIISQAQINYMVDKFQSYASLKQAIHHDRYMYYLAFDEQTCIGYCGIKIIEERLFLSKLYIKKEYRGKGISSTLFQKAVDYANEHGCHAIYLTCNKYNQHSLDVYAHYGFTCIDSVQTDIGHDMIMDDYILQLSL